MTGGALSLAPGTVLAQRYRVDGLLGRGSMGAVYRGTQLSVKRPVAIKMIASDVMGGEPWQERFEREALLTSQLSHPNTIRVYDYGSTDSGDHFLVMELLKGRTLFEAIAEEAPMPLERAVDLCVAILGALDEAHHHGVVHRDLKPSNVFLTEMGRGAELVKVLDFGVAKISEDEGARRLTHAHSIVGTPQYMSPEQCRDEPLDGRADIYAVGCILVHMLTGLPPYIGEHIVDVIFQHISAPVPNLCESRPDLPRSFCELVQRMMAKSADDRPETAHAAAEQLDAAMKRAEDDQLRTAPMDALTAEALASSAAAAKAQKGSRKKAAFRISRTAPVKPSPRRSDSAPLPARRAPRRTVSARHPPPPRPAVTPAVKPTRRAPSGPAPINTGELDELPASALVPDTEPGVRPLTAKRPAKPHRPAKPMSPTKTSRAAPRAAPPKPKPAVQRATLEFEFMLKGHRGKTPPSVRIWVDVNSDRSMDDNEEITDLERGKGSWRGRRQLVSDDSEGIGFLVKFRASEGARYRLRVYSDLPRRHLVFEQTERASKPEERIIGWCRK